MPLAPKSKTSSEDLNFLELSGQLSRDVRGCGISLVPYRDASLPLFSKLPVDHKRLVLMVLQEQVDLYSEMKNNGEKLVDTRRLLWRSLNRMGLRPLSDILDKIEDDDVVEVYTPENVQVFRNLNFFRFISISLEEMVSHTWYQIAEMDKIAADYYMTLGPKMLENSLKETFPSPLRAYHARELIGANSLIECNPRWISPVFKGPQCAGIISVLRCRAL